ncbi:MAG: pilus assembly protein PilM [Candidatus Omnitrophota bacterium]|nr:pilus assembly protein PilM [Candidatus Omnitrophota bacterium]
MPKEITTVVELAETCLKLVQSQDSPQGAVLSRILFKELALNNETEIAKSLRELLANQKINNEGVTCVVPRSQATVRMLKLPSEDPAEIDNMVNLQIAKHTPYTREEVVVDYIVAGKDSQGNSLVMLVIVHKDVVNRYLNIFKAAKLELKQLALSSQGICNLYLYYQNKLRLTADRETLVILDIDKADTEVCFYYQGNLVFSRAVQFGNQEISQERISSFLDELDLTLSTFNKEKIFPPVKRIILTSASPALDPLSQRIESELSLNVEIINPQAELLKEKNVSLPLNWVESQISASAILGLALQKPAKALNLMPYKIIAEHKEQNKKREMIKLIGLFLLIIGLILSSVLARIYKKYQYLNTIAKSMENTGPKASEVEKMLKKLELIRERLDPAASPVDIIYYMYEMFPSGMSLTELDVDEGRNISLQGISYVMADVFNFQSLLEKSPRFKNVEVKFARKRNTRLGEITDFRIICQVEKKVK